MKELIIENRLPVPIFMKVEMTSKIDEETGENIIETLLYFEPPECENPELYIREVETMEQYTFDLPENSRTDLNLGDVGRCVNFETVEDHETLFVRLISLRPAAN